MPGKTIKELHVGDYASYQRTITTQMVDVFAEISGDHNPVHLNDQYAKNTMFGQRIAHGALVSSLFSTILGTELPGEGCIYMSQSSKFVAPVKIGDSITATVRVKEIMPEKNRVLLETIAQNQEGTTVVVGEALVYPRK